MARSGREYRERSLERHHAQDKRSDKNFDSDFYRQSQRKNEDRQNRRLLDERFPKAFSY